MIEDRDWQKIGYGTSRLRVLGGWFIMLFTGGPSKTAFFYPDPNHEWDGSTLKDPTPAQPPAPAIKVPVNEPSEVPAPDPIKIEAAPAE